MERSRAGCRAAATSRCLYRGRNDVAGWSLPADIPQPIDWVSSPLLRAVATAQLLAGSAPRIEPALTEMDWGAWEGYSLDELRHPIRPRIRTKRKSRARLPSARRGKSARRRRACGALAGIGRRAGRFDRRGDAQRRAARAARARDRLGHARQAARQAAARDAAPVHAGARTAANVVACNVPLSLGGACASDSGVSYPA